MEIYITILNHSLPLRLMTPSDFGRMPRRGLKYLLLYSADSRTRKQECPVSIPSVVPAFLQIEVHFKLSLLFEIS